MKRTRAGTGLSQGVAALKRIGDELERRWGARGHRPQAFPQLAADCLRESHFQPQFDEEEIVRWVNRAESLPPQFDARSSFGQPPLTVWGNERFVLDLYFWVDTETSIHDHSFSGAFMNLSGQSLNCSYRFDETSRAGKGLLTGALRLERATVVRPGDVCPITAGSRFIHRVWHLDCPTVTLVARTIRRPAGLRQYSYFSQGVAVEYKQRPPIEFQRRREFLNYLFRRRHPRRVALAEEMLARADAWGRYLLLHDLVAYHLKGDDAHELEGVVGRLPAGSRAWLDAGLSAMRAPHPLAPVYWSRLRRTEHRLLVALLCTFSERRPFVAWLAEHGYGAGRWRAQVSRWLSEMDADKALRLHLGSARAEIIKHLLDGLSAAETIGELRKTYAISAAEAELLEQGCRRFQQLPFIKFLLPPRSTRRARYAAERASAP